MEYKMISNFQNRLIELIELSKLNQKEFADKIDTSKSIINRYVHRGDNPKADRIIHIANTFNINPLWLMGCDVPINGTVIAENIVYQIPLLNDICCLENLFSIKNYKGMISNIIDLDINYQYFYYDMDNKRFLVQIKSEYDLDDVVISIYNGNEIKIITLKEIDNTDYKIVGKLICVSIEK